VCRREGPLAETEIIHSEIVPPAGTRPARASVVSPLHVAATAPALEKSDAILKRCVDVAIAGLGVIVFTPLMIVLAILVKLDSRGPALFAQTRVGQGGRTFRMLKLRTMREGAEREQAAVAELNQHDDPRLFKIPADPRVTRLGRVIRRWSLDELPQLFNIIAGDMSLVGPRPFFESDLADYEAHHFRRLAVQPGLTGLWQVSGRSDIVNFEEVVRLDRYYIEHWSIGLDFRILARTVPAVVSRRGAY
jgi:lipopolysaccharide/colanic/teichoic acid biosynthesis glycosyltransferase